MNDLQIIFIRSHIFFSQVRFSFINRYKVVICSKEIAWTTKRDRWNFAVNRFCNSAHCTSIARMTFFEFQIDGLTTLITYHRATTTVTFPIGRLAIVLRSMRNDRYEIEKNCRFSDHLAVSDIIKMLHRKFRSVVQVAYLFAQKTTGRSCDCTTYY